MNKILSNMISGRKCLSGTVSLKSYNKKLRQNLKKQPSRAFLPLFVHPRLRPLLSRYQKAPKIFFSERPSYSASNICVEHLLKLY